MARDDFGKRQYSKDPYWNLGAEIIRSGISSNDISFLKSDWCARLESLMGLRSSAYELWKIRREIKCRQNCKK